MRRFYRRPVRRIATDCGGLGPKTWSWWHRGGNSAILIAPFLAGIAVAIFIPDFWPLLFFYSIGIILYLRWKR